MTPFRLVVSRPAPISGTRRPFSTFQAMQSIIDSAQSSLFLVFWAITDEALPLVESIAARARDGVRVTFCLHDGKGRVETLTKLWPKDAPEPRLYLPNRRTWKEGNLHAKLIVADGKSALVTSANLTGWATDRNLEVGVVVDERMARELYEYLLNLLRSRTLLQIPFPHH
jgi:cardiolipin synthase A/B